jgi:glyoxylase-like metal-dependent hydrolase (beta-lactamase superfamily II)
MNLEDHLGDIIRKGRLMSGTTTTVAAKAAVLTESELAELEDSGKSTTQTDFRALASAIGLAPGKLEGIARGWLPAAQDLGRWRHLRTFTTAGDGITVNAYLVWDEAARAAALFDTGFDSRPILDLIIAERLLLRDIFITHSHHDHIAALAEIRTTVPQAKVHSQSKTAPSDQRLKANETFQVGGLTVSFRETPGHATDGVTYLVGNWPDNAPPVAIVGDAIFAGSMGRGNQSWELARQKVQEHILSLPPDTLLCPGHGPRTTVGEEQQGNPFF